MKNEMIHQIYWGNIMCYRAIISGTVKWLSVARKVCL